MIDENSISLAFLGDISLNDDYNVLYDRGEKPFKQIGSFFAKTMWALANANEVENIGEHGRGKVNSYFSISSLSRKLLYIIDDKYNI